MNTTSPPAIVKFFLRSGGVIDWPVKDPNFTMMGLVSTIRSNGYFLSPDLYVPAEDIACIGYGSAAQILHPSGQTMQ